MTEPIKYRPRMTLEIYHDSDWCGTLSVGYYSDDIGAFWSWMVGNGKGGLLDSGESLEMAGPQTPTEAMRVLLLFLLATGEPFNDTVREWARMHQDALQQALSEL